MLNELTFYKKYFDCSVKDATTYKIDFLNTIIKNGKIYKFIAFDSNKNLNKIKMNGIQNEVLWFSHYIYLNDKSEFEIKYNAKQISKYTNVSCSQIHYLIGIIKEMYDVCSFTYDYEQHMWRDYANDGEGICICYDVKDMDMLYPVEYVEKDKINFTSLIIQSIIQSHSIALSERMKNIDPMSILPFVIKNPMNGELLSYKEKEVRILYSAYDDGSLNQGVIYPNVKAEKQYRGSNMSYKDCGLKVNKIIIGNKCSNEIERKLVEVCTEKDYLYEKINGRVH